jgi:hypothetical protein
MAYFLIPALIILAVVGYWQYRSWKNDSRPMSHFRCMHCQQKLRFEPRSAGRKIMCPRCLRTCTIPRATEQPALESSPPMAFYARRQ